MTDRELLEAAAKAAGFKPPMPMQAGWTLDEHEPNRFTTLARAVERAHGIGKAAP